MIIMAILITGVRYRQNTEFSIASLLVSLLRWCHSTQKMTGCPTYLSGSKQSYVIPNFTFFCSTIRSQIYWTLRNFNKRMSSPRTRSNSSQSPTAALHRHRHWQTQQTDRVSKWAGSKVHKLQTNWTEHEEHPQTELAVLWWLVTLLWV